MGNEEGIKDLSVKEKRELEGKGVEVFLVSEIKGVTEIEQLSGKRKEIKEGLEFLENQ